MHSKHLHTHTHTRHYLQSLCVCVCVDCTCKCYHSWLVTVSVSHRPQPQDVRHDLPGCLFECVSVGVLKLLREKLWSSQSVQLPPSFLPLPCFASLPNPFEQVLLVIRHFAWPKIKFLLSIIYGLICLPLRAALQELTWQQLINYSTKATYKPSSRTGI